MSRCSTEKLSVKMLITVSCSYLLTSQYRCALSSDVAILVPHKCPIIGEQVVVIFTA